MKSCKSVEACACDIKWCDLWGFCVGFPTLAMVLAINCQGPAQGGRQGGQNTARVARGSNLLDVSYQDNPCGKWRVAVVGVSLAMFLFWRFQVHQRGGQFLLGKCANRKNCFGEILGFFFNPKLFGTLNQLPCVQDLRIARWTCLSVDGFVYWLWNLWMFLLTHLHLCTQVPPILRICICTHKYLLSLSYGETMSKIWNSITWTKECVWIDIWIASQHWDP